MRRVGIVVSALFLVMACGQAVAPSTSSDYKLYLAATTQRAAQLAVVDTRSQRTDRDLPLGTPSPDWRHLYWVSGDGRLMDTDPLSGATLNTMRLPGAYQLPTASIAGLPGGLSQDGRWLTLLNHDRLLSPTVSQFLVVDTAFRKAPVQIALHGFFDFDAISNDGRRLYLVEYTGGNGYRVRVYDVLAGALDPQVVVDKADGNDAMAGVRLTSVFSSGGSWQYSVYARQNDGAFIHALNLDGSVSGCIFLPGPGYAASPDAFRWSLAMSRDGAWLYATNAALGYAAKVSVGDSTWPSLGPVERIAISSTASIAPVQDVQAKEFGGNASAVSPDGKTLVTAGASGVMWLDTVGLQVRHVALDGWRVWSVGLTPDGRELYVLGDTGMIARVSMGSGAVEARFNPGAGLPVGLLRVAAPET